MPEQGLSVVLCAAVLLLTGAVLRLLYLGEIPAGLNQDEASAGYEAWALLHHGITRNGYAWPVHFVSWGSGQNALYSYLSIPIIAAFDLTVFSTRLLMALTGAASLLLFWRVAARDQPARADLADDAGDGVTSAQTATAAARADLADDAGDGVTSAQTATAAARAGLADDAGDGVTSAQTATAVARAGLADDAGDGALFGRITARDQSAFALLALLLLTFCPWHIMLSRWSIESNFLPFVILLAVYFFTRPDNDRLGVQAAGVLVLSLSVYAYGTAYFFAPVFLALVFVWLGVQGKLSLRHFVLLSTLALVTVLPILLFLAVNVLDWEAIRAGISIPKYTGRARYEQVSTVFGGRFREYLVDQLLFVVKLLTMSDPDVPTLYFNKLPHFAVVFPFAIVPLAVGFGATLVRAVTRRECGVPLLMAVWLIAALATNAITEVNITRANVVWLPAVYFTALGVFYACRRWRVVLALAVVAYLIYGGWFVQTYFMHYNDRHDRGGVDHMTFHDLQSALASVVAHASPRDTIYITRFVHEAYMLTLFHTKTPPQDYLNTRIIADPTNVPFQKINAFGQFIFTPQRISEADHLILLAHPDQPNQVAMHGEEVPFLNSATLSTCTGERHGLFYVLQCE